MKKVVISTTAILLFSTPAFALFTNGGFEDGTFNGWGLDFGTVISGPAITWGASDHGLYDVIDSTGTMPGQSFDVDPYNGTYMARINDITGYNHATRISQSDTISQQDIDDGATIYVNWGAMLLEPTNNVSHTTTQPFFGIEVSINGSTVDSFMADATAHATDATWSLAGGGSHPSAGDLWYKQDTWTLDISSYALGSTVSISMWVADCGLGGHGGYAFLDGIGTIDPRDPAPVPEPSTMLLMGAGLLGLVGYNRKRFSKKS